ncbi:MAG: pentapeptide repeat-containing protein [Ornithinibacter sp.]
MVAGGAVEVRLGHAPAGVLLAAGVAGADFAGVVAAVEDFFAGALRAVVFLAVVVAAVDFAGVDFAGVDFAGVDFAGVDFAAVEVLVAGALRAVVFFAVVEAVAVFVAGALRAVVVFSGAFFAGAFLAGAFLAGAFLAGAFFAAVVAGALLAAVDAFFAGAVVAGAFFAGAVLAGAATRAGSGPSSVSASATGPGVRVVRPVAERARSSTCAANPATVAASDCTSVEIRLTSSLPTAESTSRRTKRTSALRLACAACSSSSASPLTCLAAFLREASEPARARISAAASLAALRVSSPSPDASST